MRDALFRDASRSFARLDPDGRRVGWLEPVNGVTDVVIASISSSERPLARFELGPGVRGFWWGPGAHDVLFLTDTDGDENTRLVRVDISTGDRRALTPGGARAEVLGDGLAVGGRLAVAINLRDPGSHDLYELVVTSGELRLVSENPGYVEWLLDCRHRPRGGLRLLPDGACVVDIAQDHCGRTVWYRAAPEDAWSTRLVGMQGPHPLVLSSRGADRTQLVRLTGPDEEETVFAHGHHDVDDVVLEQRTGSPLVACVWRDGLELHVLDERMRSDVSRIVRRHWGNVTLLRCQPEDRVWLYEHAGDDEPPSTFVFDRDANEVRELFAHRPALRAMPMVALRPTLVTARDGLELNAYVSSPSRDPGRRPGVVVVHGGPWDRAVRTFDPIAQWLASLGYVCAQVNFRGSSGFGRSFLDAGDRQWGTGMIDDLLDAVGELDRAAVIDPARVAIFGASFGGYAALMATIRAPGTFRCAVDVMGPVDLLALLDELPAYWAPWTALLHRRIGHPVDDHDLLVDQSPLTHVGRISAPVLVVHGANDARVSNAGTDRLVRSLRDHAVPYEHVVFPDEGHVVATEANRLALFEIAERFLLRHLGPAE